MLSSFVLNVAFAAAGSIYPASQPPTRPLFSWFIIQFWSALMSYDDIHIENDEQRFRACIFWWDFTKGRRGWWWLWWSWLLTLLEDRRDPTTLSLSITLEVQQAAQDRIIGRVINGRRGFQRMRHVRMEMGCLAGLVCQFVTSEFSWGNE